MSRARTDLEILSLYAEVTKAEYDAVVRLIKSGTRQEVARGVEALRDAGRLPPELTPRPAIHIPGRN